MRDSLTATPFSLRGHQKIKRYSRKLIQGAPGHKKLDPNEKRFKAFHKFKREEDDK